ncbi:hypothetical protein C0995_007770, partial [Termitomyces sp. Mi166
CYANLPRAAFPIKGKGKAKVMEEDDDDKDEVTQRLQEELENFVVLIMFDDKQLVALLLLPMEHYKADVGLLQGAKISDERKGNLTLVVRATWMLVLEKNGVNGIGIRVQKKCPPIELLVLEKHVKMVWAAKVFLKHQGKPLEGKGKSKALVADTEQTGINKAFRSKKMVESNSNEEEEEERVHVIKRIMHKHVEELTGAQKGKGVDELHAMVAPKAPVAGPSCLTLKLVVLISGMSKPVYKASVVPKVPTIGPSSATPLQTATSVPMSVPPVSMLKIVASAPAPATLATKPAKKEASVAKDLFPSLLVLLSAL